ncbi:MAG: hypothetical protein ACFFA3_03420 [Promethearchaeota archaeon]
MTEIVFKKPEREDKIQIDGIIISSSRVGIKSFLIEAIEASRFDRVFNIRFGGYRTYE